MKVYEIVMKVVRREFYSVSITSASSCLVQLFSVIWPLIYFIKGTPKK